MTDECSRVASTLGSCYANILPLRAFVPLEDGLTIMFYRPNLQLSGQVDLGIHLLSSCSKCLSTMACLRPTDALASLDMDRERKRWRSHTCCCVLDSESTHVCAELRVGRLGVARTPSIIASQAHCCSTCRILIRYLDLSDTHFLQLD